MNLSRSFQIPLYWGRVEPEQRTDALPLALLLGAVADAKSRRFEISLSARETLENLGVSRATAHRWMDDLISKGWVQNCSKSGTCTGELGPMYGEPRQVHWALEIYRTEFGHLPRGKDCRMLAEVIDNDAAWRGTMSHWRKKGWSEWNIEALVRTYKTILVLGSPERQPDKQQSAKQTTQTPAGLRTE